MYQKKIVKKVTKNLIKEWKELWKISENANIYNSYEWFLTSQEIHAVKEYELYTLYKNNTLVAILPLQVYKCFGVTVKGSINKEHLVDTPFLIEKNDKELFEKFFTFVFKDNVYLQKIDEKSVKILNDIFPKSFYSLISINPILPLTGNPIDSITPSTVKQIKKIINKNSGHLRFEIYDKNLLKHMKTLFEIQKNSSKHARSMDIFENEEVKQYYLALVKNFEKSIRICFLYMDKLPIAYQYGFFYKNYFAGDQISFHKEYSKLRPGKVIIYYLIEYLKKINATVLDQGGGISMYKREFTKEYRLLYNLYYSSNNFIMIWWKMINKVRRLKQILFPKKNTKDHEFLFKTY
jgi:hypothetical protein